MKTTLLSLMLGLLAASSVFARNPQPLPFHQIEHPPACPIRKVVLVHGFLENGSNFWTMKNRLEKLGVQCLVPKLQPSDGRGGLEGVAVRLKQDIDAAFGTRQPISIISFSMGGVVSRYYLEKLGGAARCEKFFTISSPHHGTLAAYIYPSKGAAQMRPNSEFLTDLAKNDFKLGKIPVVSYRTPMDFIIIPPSNSIWDRAQNLEYPVLGHPLMVTSNAVLSDIEQRLLK